MSSSDSLDRSVPPFTPPISRSNSSELGPRLDREGRKSAKRNIKTFFLIKLISTFILKRRFITTRDVCLTGGNFFWLFSVFSPRFVCVHPKRHFKLVVCGESGIDGARIIFWPWPIGPRILCAGEGGKLLSIYCFIIYVHGSRVIILYPPRAREICRIFYPTRPYPSFDPTDSWRTDGRTSPFCSTIGMTTCFFLLFAAHRITTDFGLD